MERVKYNIFPVMCNANVYICYNFSNKFNVTNIFIMKLFFMLKHIFTLRLLESNWSCYLKAAVEQCIFTLATSWPKTVHKASLCILLFHNLSHFPHLFLTTLPSPDNPCDVAISHPHFRTRACLHIVKRHMLSLL